MARNLSQFLMHICGSLLYTIRPIQEALEMFYARQMAWADAALQQQSVERRLAKLAPVSLCEPLCVALGQAKGKEFRPER